MLDFVCSGIGSCTDLSPSLLSVGDRELDTGYDGHHYGPIANAAIATAVADVIAK